MSVSRPIPADVASVVERFTDLIGDAYASGCVDVHNAWVADLGQLDPDFGEATSDYKASIAPLVATLLTTLASGREDAWMPIETAPKEGTAIDVWRSEGGRETVYWGLPLHTCGEMGEYCDSDWHSIKNPGWVCSMFGEFLGGKHNPFTHWRPLPIPPTGEA